MIGDRTWLNTDWTMMEQWWNMIEDGTTMEQRWYNDRTTIEDGTRSKMEHGWRWLKMIEDGWRWLKMIEHNWTWLNMIEHGTTMKQRWNNDGKWNNDETTMKQR